MKNYLFCNFECLDSRSFEIVKYQCELLNAWVELSLLYLPMTTVVFTNRLSRLKPKASEKMKGFITNNEDIFCFTSIFAVKTGHLKTCRPFYALSISVIK